MFKVNLDRENNFIKVSVAVVLHNSVNCQFNMSAFSIQPL